MRIPVPWPAPERGIAYPTEARYIFLQSGPTLDEAEKVGPVIVDCFTPEGLFAAEWEASLWELRKRYPGMQVILQATALPPALIFPDKWGSWPIWYMAPRGKGYIAYRSRPRPQTALSACWRMAPHQSSLRTASPGLHPAQCLSSSASSLAPNPARLQPPKKAASSTRWPNGSIRTFLHQN